MKPLAISNGSSDLELLGAAKSVVTKGSPEAAAALAEVLAKSGVIISHHSKVTADVASTGGPTSLSTLLCPLYLCAAGVRVPKLGVPGRPAGGIDCLAQIQGYRYQLSSREVERVLDRCGFAHFIANGDMAPLDGRLFRLRQEAGMQNIPILAVASILSKKLAVGVGRVGLDVRVAPWGNFGSNDDEALSSAALFRSAAALHQIEAFTFLTDGTQPYQPLVGRAESMCALARVFDGRHDPSLESHNRQCMEMAAATSGKPDVVRGISQIALRSAFAANLSAQGSSIDAFDELVEVTTNAHRYVIVASCEIYFDADLPLLRDVMVRAQRDRLLSGNAEFPDPIGIEMLRKPAETVAAGTALAAVRATEPIWDKYGADLTRALDRSSDMNDLRKSRND